MTLCVRVCVHFAAEDYPVLNRQSTTWVSIGDRDVAHWLDPENWGYVLNLRHCTGERAGLLPVSFRNREIPLRMCESSFPACAAGARNQSRIAVAGSMSKTPP